MGRAALRSNDDFGMQLNLFAAFDEPQEKPAPAPVVLPRAAEPEPEPMNWLLDDYRISGKLGEGSLKEKALANIAAIQTLKRIEAEQRPASAAEKAVLVSYTGWGALSALFQAESSRSYATLHGGICQHTWAVEQKQLQALLTTDEYKAAKASTPNAHYTSTEVLHAIWNGIERLGIRPGARILEPSVGIGHFFGSMPEALHANAARVGVELDSISARIAVKLYPNATIYAKGFEATPFPKHFFDLVVGNIPFGNYPVFDATYKSTPHLTRAIHDYFLAKSIDLVRPGGIVALITSRYTMDKARTSIRAHLAQGAVLLGAIRLPNTTFQQNAGTDVTTDILFLQKRSAGDPAGESWTNVESFRSALGHNVRINEYFIRHPEMMLGTIGLESSRYGPVVTLAGTLTAEMLSSAIKRLPLNVVGRHAEPVHPPERETQIPAIDTIKDGAFGVYQKRLVVRKGNIFEPVSNLGALSQARLRGMIQLRDSVRCVFRTQLEDAGEFEIAQARLNLNREYTAFVDSYGFVSSKENVRLYSDDPDAPLLLALEDYDEGAKTGTKTAILERRTLNRYTPAEHVESASEALLVCLNETGRVIWSRIEQLTGRKAIDLQVELDTLIYQNPAGAEWETAESYLSGNVRVKLATAHAAATVEPIYQRNVKALLTVQPKDLEATEIDARLGSSWIPCVDIRRFVSELINTPITNVTVSYAESIAIWRMELDWSAKNLVSNTNTYGTGRFTATQLIEHALNGKIPTAYDKNEDGTSTLNQPETLAGRERQHQLKERFGKWIWSDQNRAIRLARLYNDQFNNIRLREYDGSHLTFPGMMRTHLRDGDLAPHQKNAVWRILQGGSHLLAHAVGAGKSICMAAAAMELRRMGLSHKPMFVVPNHLVAQWGAEFLKVYPQARLFVAGKDHFCTGNRQRAMARIAAGNFDAVIVSHRSFEALPVSDDYFNLFLEQQMDAIEDEIRAARDDADRNIIKELEKAKKRLEVRIRKRADRDSKDRALTFEELGIDQLFVDEADIFKNLGYASKMTRIAGLPNSDSNRALDMFLKVRYIQEKSGDGRGVVFATGTPISNTIAEMYTTLRYLAPELLAERGVAFFDPWAANFGEAVTALELAPDGAGYRMHTRFARFINLPELLMMFRSMADVKTADQLNLPSPKIQGGKPQVHATPGSDELKAFVQTLVERAHRLKTERVDPKDDNMLKIVGEGRKAALDLRLVLPDALPVKTKVDAAVEQIYSIWETTAVDRLTQLVFCDLSTPDPQKFNVYNDVRAKLQAAGIPESDIAFIHDAATDGDKKKLFDAVNAGRIRVVLGSTEKMGAGTNMQKRLVALHHLDAPWRPRDIEQREGRILRQGNNNAEVQIYRYVTEGSFDAYMWQTLETKARFIQQVMRGESAVRSAEDLESGVLTYAEIKAIASGNPAVIEKVKIDTEVRMFDQLRAMHLNQQRNMIWQIQDLPGQIIYTKNYLNHLKSDIATRTRGEEALNNDEFSITIGRRVFTGKNARDNAGAALIQAAQSWRTDPGLQELGQYLGFRIYSRGSIVSKTEPELLLQATSLYHQPNFNASSASGTIQSIERTLKSLENKVEDYARDQDRKEKQLADLQATAERPFEHEARLQSLLTRQAEINKLLDLGKDDRQAASVEEEKTT